MGSCVSKKDSTSNSTTVTKTNPLPLPDPSSKSANTKLEEEKKKPITLDSEKTQKKEVFIVKQRRSHERRPSTSEDKSKNSNVSGSKVEELLVSSPTSGNVPVVLNGGGVGNSGILLGSGGAPVRTSSCTKEEVESILIQCGRLSRSSSGNRKYSGSKRSYDFDHEINDKGEDVVANENGETEHRHRHHQRHHSRSSHRRTPSREKDVDSSKRSGSRERYSSSREEERGGRSNGGGSRRVSRSPGRRSETPSGTNAGAGGLSTADKSRPGKMVSVPASVSTRGDKNVTAASATANGGDSGTGAGLKRVSVKRNGEVGHRTTAASPRSQSPANIRASSNNENHHQPSLSRNGSRKAEHSPYRRNPLNEIDENCIKSSEILKTHDQKVQKSKETDQGLTKKASHLQNQQKSDGRNNSKVTELAQVTTNIVEDHPHQPIEEVKGGVSLKPNRMATGGATETLKPQGITRTRSARKSRDFDIKLGTEPDTLLNPTSYASLLLEDIQNFHQQKNTNTSGAAAATNTTATAPAFTLPACVTKACSILDAVADLNSCAGSNLSSTYSNEDRICFEATEKPKTNKNFKQSGNGVPFNPLGKKRLEVNDPFIESELVVGDDDLMEPSLHKYITVRRGVNVISEGEMEQQESSGSNSFVGGQNWVSSSSSQWEPNSADSNDRWSSRSNTSGGGEKDEPRMAVGSEKQTSSAAPIRRKREIPIVAASM